MYKSLPCGTLSEKSWFWLPECSKWNVIILKISTPEEIMNKIDMYGDQ